MAQSPTRISARIAAITESATLAVDAKAKALKAAGRPVIGFGAGEPDFPTPDHIVAAAQRACAVPRYQKYTPAAGLPELREAIATKSARDSGLMVNASQVLVTNGGKQAVYQAFATLLDPGDEVLLPTPYWTTYPESIKLAGGVPVLVHTDETSGYRTTARDLEAHCTDRTKVLLFVSPSNPTGAVYPPEQVAEIGRWAAGRGLWVLTDEIYEHLVYGDARFVSMPVVAPEIADTCVVLNGVAKTYAMTGWRVGWMAGPEDVIRAASNLQSHATSNVCNVAQAAALEAVSGDLSAVAQMRAAFDRRRTMMTSMLNEIPGVVCPLPEGAFYCYPSVKGVLGKQIAGQRPQTSAQLAELLLDEADVAVVPGEAFGTDGYFRLSCALGDADLEEGVSRIVKLLSTAS
jgi:aspartate aminotransferase